MRHVGCFAIVVLTILCSVEKASAQDLLEVQQISNWPTPALWSLPGKVMDKAEISPEEAEAVPTAPLHFVGLTPCRLLDTRGNGFTGQYGPPALTQGSPRNFALAGQCGISPTAQAVSLNITVTNTQGPGFILIYPQGGAQPNVSTLNYVGGQTVANAAVVPLGTGGGVTVIAGVSGADLIIDTNGDYRAGVVTSVTAGAGLTGGGTGAVTLSVAAGGGVPSGSSVLGSPNDTTLVAAGFTETGFTQDFWKATTLTQAPSARTGAGGVWTGSRMIVWSGGDFTPTVFNTGAQYDPVADSWTPTSTTNAPAGRVLHAVVWTGSRMVVWGGATDVAVSNTGGIYDPVANSWLPGGTSTTNAPTARYSHTAVWTGSKMIVWGGTSDGTNGLNTGGQFDPVANSWLAGGTSLTNAPTVRTLHSAVWTGSQMIVWGGIDGSNYLDTGGLYSPGSNTWFAGGTSTTNVPSTRRSHSVVWTGSRMVVWGGNAGVNLDTGGRYDPVGNSWTATSAVGAPSARSDHSAVWTGSKMIVWGGRPNQTPGTGGLYDPAADSWFPTPTANAPAGRQGHVAVWTGSRMIVWGGSVLGTVVNTGGVYAILSLYVKN
jgi:hypothetical protein